MSAPWLRRFAPWATFVALAGIAGAHVIVDSRVVTATELAALGVRITVSQPPGRNDAERVEFVIESFAADGGTREFRSMAWAVMERPLDEDFVSTDARKIGERDAHRWARQRRGDATEARLLRFGLTRPELPSSYLVVHFRLRGDHRTHPLSGTYYQ